jgi:hypothetical protein
MFQASINQACPRAQAVFLSCLGNGSSSTAILEFGAPVLRGVEAASIFAVDSDPVEGTRVRPQRIGLYLARLTAGVGASGTIQAGILAGNIPSGWTANPDYANAGGLFTTPAAAAATYVGCREVLHLGATNFQIAAQVTDGAAGAPTDLVLASVTLAVTYIGLLDPS